MSLIPEPAMRRNGYEKLCRLMNDAFQADDQRTLAFWMARYQLFRKSTYHDAQPIYRDIMNAEYGGRQHAE